MKQIEPASKRPFRSSCSLGFSSYSPFRQPDKGLWHSTRGVTGNKLMPQIGPDTKFYAGSIGKIFTSVVVLRLIEEGKLNLETQIARWFPGMRSAENVTINHLLTHTSGIASFDVVNENDPGRFKYRTPKELLLSVKSLKTIPKWSANFSGLLK